MGIISCFKARARSEIRKELLNEFDKHDLLNANSASKKLTLLDAIQISSFSWNNVSEQTISNCWRKAKIWPNHEELNLPSEDDIIETVLPLNISRVDFENWVTIDDYNSIERENAFETSSNTS